MFFKCKQCNTKKFFLRRGLCKQCRSQIKVVADLVVNSILEDTKYTISPMFGNKKTENQMLNYVSDDIELGQDLDTHHDCGTDHHSHDDYTPNNSDNCCDCSDCTGCND